jgi:hypothetical protein
VIVIKSNGTLAIVSRLKFWPSIKSMPSNAADRPVLTMANSCTFLIVWVLFLFENYFIAKIY